jgi:hypothetical protein
MWYAYIQSRGMSLSALCHQLLLQDPCSRSGFEASTCLRAITSTTARQVNEALGLLVIAAIRPRSCRAKSHVLTQPRQQLLYLAIRVTGGESDLCAHVASIVGVGTHSHAWPLRHVVTRASFVKPRYDAIKGILRN